jgi:hypothetical protein
MERTTTPQRQHSPTGGQANFDINNCGDLRSRRVDCLRLRPGRSHGFWQVGSLNSHSGNGGIVEHHRDRWPRSPGHRHPIGRCHLAATDRRCAHRASKRKRAARIAEHQDFKIYAVDPLLYAYSRRTSRSQTRGHRGDPQGGRRGCRSIRPSRPNPHREAADAAATSSRAVWHLAPGASAMP